MAEQIKKSDIIGDDVLPALRKELESILTVIEKFDDNLKSVAKSFKTLTDVEKKRLEGINKLNQQQLQAEKLVKEKIKNDRERIKNQQQLTRLEGIEAQNKIRLTKEAERQAKATERANKAVKDQESAYKRLVKQTRDYKNKSKDLGATLLELESAGRRNTKEYKGLASQFDNVTKKAQKGDKQLKKLDKTVGDNFRKVGNYKSAIVGLRNALGALGIAFGIREAVNFGRDLVELNNQSTGVAFAFQKLGEEGEDAFNRVKAATRGTLSDLDIQKSLVEFDNFNLSLKESDTLFQFLATRASQTGKSVDSLKDSLVEGLSKESKLRIDNLGISAGELNAELEKTPDFTQAVANIAKRELAEAGDILDTAASEQAKWNSEIENTKVQLAQQLKPIFDTVFKTGVDVLKFVTENFSTLLTIGGKVIKFWLLYRAQVALFGKDLKKANLGSVLTMLKGLPKALMGAIKGFKLSAISARSLGNAIKSIPIFAIIGLITELVSVIKDWTSELSLAEKKQKDLIDVTKDANESIVEQKVKSESLFNVAKDLNRSYEDREKAVQALNRISPEYLGNLTVENAATKEGERLMNNYTAALLKNARAKAIEDRIIELNKEKLNAGKQAAEEISSLSEFAFDFDSQQAGQSLLFGYLFGTDDSEARKVIKGKVKDRMDIIKKEYDARINNLALQLNQSDITSLLDEPISNVNTNENKSSGNNPSNQQKEQLSLLQKLKDERSEKIKQLEKIVDLETDENSKPILKSKREIKDLGEQIELLEEKLRLEDEVLRLPTRDAIAELNKLKKEDLEITVETNEEVIKEEINFVQKFNDLQQSITDGLIENVDKRIEALKREQDAAQNQQEFLQELAAQGDIETKQSIKEQIQLQREAQKEQERLERRKQQLQLISQGLATFTSSIDGGATPAEALANTVITSQALVSYLAGLQGFEKGTDNAPKGLAWTQEKGAEIITDKNGNIKSFGSDGGAVLTNLNAGDKVKTAQESQRMIEKFRMLNDVQKVKGFKDHVGTSYDMMRLESKVDKMTQAITNKPVPNFDISNLGEMVKTTNRGRSIQRTIYRQ